MLDSWILAKRYKQKENILVLADLWGRPHKVGVVTMQNDYALLEER